MEGPGGYAGASLGEPRLVVKTFLELAMRARRQNKGGKAAAAAAAEGFGKSKSELPITNESPPTPTSGAEADHTAVEACLVALCRYVGCSKVDRHTSKQATAAASATVSVESAFAVAQRALAVVQRDGGLESLGCTR